MNYIQYMQTPSGTLKQNPMVHIQESTKQSLNEQLGPVQPETDQAEQKVLWESLHPEDNRSLYQKYTESKFGKAMDYVDLGLDMLSMVPVIGPIAGAAGVVTGAPVAALAAYDAYKNGLNLSNATDMMKVIPAGSMVKLGTKQLKNAGKTTKYVKHAHPYFSPASPNPNVKYGQISGIDMIKTNPKYAAYFGPIYALDAANLGADVTHIIDNYNKQNESD